MQFHESKLLRLRPFRQALVEILMSAIEQMSDEEWREFTKRQFGFFQHSTAPGLNKKLQDQRNAVIPAGFLGFINSESTYISASIDTMIEMAVGANTSKFCIPCSILLRAARPSFVKDSASLTHSIVRTGIHAVVFTRLASHCLLHRIQLVLNSAKHPGPERLEVVFCILAQDFLNA